MRVEASMLKGVGGGVEVRVGDESDEKAENTLVILIFYVYTVFKIYLIFRHSSG